MSAEITTSIVTAAAAVLVAVLGYVFTKRAEREAAWRNEKLEHYKELIAAISGIMKDESTPESQQRFARACNALLLVAPERVIQALMRFQDESRQSNPNPSLEKHDQLLSELLLEMRRDLRLDSTDDPRNFRVRLWASGVRPGEGRKRA